MTMATKKEIFKRFLEEYLKVGKVRKGEILDAVCAVTGLHRKAAIRTFRALQMNRYGGLRKRGRRVVYGPDVTAALKTVWEVANEICPELLQPQVSMFIAVLLTHGEWHHRPEATELLLQMSIGTMKSRVSKFKKTRSNLRGLSSTKPSELKELVPVYSGPWRNKEPGYGQIDTVAHCGSTLKGTYVYSVNYTDIATSWGVRKAQWNKEAIGTKESMEAMRAQLPMALRGVHPDSGSEFINWEVVGWCKEQSPQIQMSRSRPNKSNDNAYVEQKNGDKVRRWLGYTRLEHKVLVPLINEFYLLLDLYDNHFIPTRKCVEKIRIGSKYKRVYDKAKTPYERVLAHPNMTMDVKESLQQIHKTLNPVQLKKKLDTMRKDIFILNKRLGSPTD
jgi:hypothetical protein